MTVLQPFRHDLKARLSSAGRCQASEVPLAERSAAGRAGRRVARRPGLARPRDGPGAQLAAFCTSAPILASSSAVNSVSAKAVGHMAPSSRCAGSLKPSVAYLVLNFCAGWKKQTTLPSFAYAGIPYHVFGERSGTLAMMMAWSRSAIPRSGSVISAIFASRSLSPSALFAPRPRRAAAFRSWAWSFIAARSSAVNPGDVLLFAVVLLADFCVSFIGRFLRYETSWDNTRGREPAAPAASSNLTGCHLACRARAGRHDRRRDQQW